MLKELIVVGCFGAAVIVAVAGFGFSGESDEVKSLRQQNQFLEQQLKATENKFLGCISN